MYYALRDLLRRLFRPSVDDVIAGFVKTIEKLEAVTKRHEESAQTKREYATQLLAEAYTHNDEAERAARVGDRLSQLMF